MITGEHEFEAAYGLPEPLPAGERILWQGQPHGPTLAREALHWRKLTLYFAVILAWRGAMVWNDGGSAWQVLTAVGGLLPLAVFAVGMALTLAWLITRTTAYTLTDRRIVMRVGIVLSLSFNLPLSRLQAVALREGRDGHGDIVLTLAPGDRIAYLHLWPHARPWKLGRPEPMLRALPQARQVANLLVQALQASVADAPLRALRPVAAGAAQPALQPQARAA
ncbi:MAG: photosynthetic complex putative assembly protein PuhB [Burkholderiaceae bacterium]